MLWIGLEEEYKSKMWKQEVSNGMSRRFGTHTGIERTEVKVERLLE